MCKIRPIIANRAHARTRTQAHTHTHTPPLPPQPPNQSPPPPQPPPPFPFPAHRNWHHSRTPQAAASLRFLRAGRGGEGAGNHRSSIAVGRDTNNSIAQHRQTIEYQASMRRVRAFAFWMHPSLKLRQDARLSIGGCDWGGGLYHEATCPRSAAGQCHIEWFWPGLPPVRSQSSDSHQRQCCRRGPQELVW